MSEVAATPLSLILPGALVTQGRAIAAMLGEVFPPSLYQFKYLPAKLNKVSWGHLTQGNQPFLGLGFDVIKPTTSGGVFSGVASWVLLAAVRANGTPQQRFYGDPQGIGVLSIATVAISVLQGRVAGGTGTIEVKAVMNVDAEEWSADSAVIGINLEIPLRLPLYDAVIKPADLGLFKEMLSTWAIPTPEGSADIFTSDWTNPNAV